MGPTRTNRRAAILDLAAAHVVRSLDGLGVPSVVLKGPATRLHVYEGGGRGYGDIDLLVPPDQWSRAIGGLESLGFVTKKSPPLPSDHAMPFENPLGIDVDLHRRIIGVTVADAECWAVVSGRSQVLSVDKANVRVPDLPTTLVVVTLHAAQHGTAKTKPLRDLARALAADGASWRSALEVADRLGARESFAAGLSLHPDGRRLAEELGIEPPSLASIRLRARSAPISAQLVAGVLGREGAPKGLAVKQILFPRREELLRRTWARRLASRWMTLPMAWPVWWLRIALELPRALRWYGRDRRARR